METEDNGAQEGVTEDTSLDQDLAQDEAPETETGDDAAAAPEAPKRKSAQDRIDELTRARREAEREAEFWRTKALQSPTPAQPQPEPQGDGRPDPNTYEGGVYDPAYIEDLAGWKAEQLVEQTLTKREKQRQTETAIEAFTRRVSEQFPDGEPEGLAALRRLPELPQAIGEVIISSENGPKLADYLGTNPRELQRLSGLAPHLQAYELAKIETRLTAPASPPPKTATDAPEPPPRARGAGGQFKVSPDTEDFAAFEKQYRPGG